MHIPDGYLSPSTCAAAYAAAVPFWYVAAERVKRLLHTRMVPLLALFSAFSFVIMMFNLPLPGGTTGHAVGMGIAAIVLGPWASIIAASIALLIQAIFFGDGGITTFGANSLNMAIIGSFVAYWTYRAVSGRSPIEFTAAGDRGGLGGLSRHQRLGPVCRGRVRPPADAVSRCGRRAALCALSPVDRHSGHDPRPLDLRRSRRTRNHRWARRLFAAGEPGDAEALGAGRRSRGGRGQNRRHRRLGGDARVLARACAC